jgi:hypothetical protein
MSVQFLLFVIAILLVLIFWELSKINSQLKKTLQHIAKGMCTFSTLSFWSRAPILQREYERVAFTNRNSSDGYTLKESR